jgi:FtsH-binding integral membrane protein
VCWLAGILSVQLALTTATCAAFMSSSGIQAYMVRNTWPLWTSLIVSFGVLFALLCNPKLARTHPHNYGLLFIFTAAESIMIGSICMVRLSLSRVLCLSTTGIRHEEGKEFICSEQ